MFSILTCKKGISLINAKNKEGKGILEKWLSPWGACHTSNEDLSSDPHSHRNLDAMVHACILGKSLCLPLMPILGEWRQKEPWSFLASKSSQISQFQVQWKILSQNRQTDRQTSVVGNRRHQLLASTCTHKHMCYKKLTFIKNAHIYTRRKQIRKGWERWVVWL